MGQSRRVASRLAPVEGCAVDRSWTISVMTVDIFLIKGGGGLETR